MTHVISSLIPALVLSFTFIMTMDFILGLIKLTRNTQELMNNNSIPQQPAVEVMIEDPLSEFLSFVPAEDEILDFPGAYGGPAAIEVTPEWLAAAAAEGLPAPFPATMNWLEAALYYVQGCDVYQEEVVEELDIPVLERDIISLAKSRLPVVAVAQEVTSRFLELASLNIRQLKKMASERKIKNYGKMNKADLIIVLS